MFDVTLVLYANQQQEMWKTVLLGATKLAKAMINFDQFLSLFMKFMFICSTHLKNSDE